MQTQKFLFSTALIATMLTYACKKDDNNGGSGNNGGSSDKCSSKNLNLTTVVVQSVSCSPIGEITVIAKGSRGWTYQLNGGAFQADSVFKGLGAGTYTVTAKDFEGCTKSAQVSITENTTRGPKFNDVVSLITLKCNVPCHSNGAGGAPTGIMSTDCKIIAIKSSIIQKAINENMGSLNNTEKAKLQDWVNAGGRYTD